jgi:hypothetical protein
VTNQVVTEYDWLDAMFNYIIDQLDGRFRLQFPDHHKTLDLLVVNMNHPLARTSSEAMMLQLNMAVSTFGSTLTKCSLVGCTRCSNHEFLREYINLIWDSRYETEQWLFQQGIIPGQSTN